MKRQVSLDELLEQIEPIKVDWINGIAEEVIETIPRVIRRLNKSDIDQSTIESLLVEETYALDVFRLFLDISQDIMLNILKPHGIKGDFRTVRGNCPRLSKEISVVLIKTGLTDAIADHMVREWKIEDILFERYKQMRGSAMRGQHRGSALENAVEVILKEIEEETGITYTSNMNFLNHSGRTAKADFMIPSNKAPFVIG